MRLVPPVTGAVSQARACALAGCAQEPLQHTVGELRAETKPCRHSQAFALPACIEQAQHSQDAFPSLLPTATASAALPRRNAEVLNLTSKCQNTVLNHCLSQFCRTPRAVTNNSLYLGDDRHR